MVIHGSLVAEGAAVAPHETVTMTSGMLMVGGAVLLDSLNVKMIRIRKQLNGRFFMLSHHLPKKHKYIRLLT